MSDQQIALAACQSVYTSCSTGSCGSFRYYYSSNHYSCDCSKGIGQKEFIYENNGGARVGEDYGGAGTSVSGNGLFVRVKASSGCNSNSWNLALADLGVDLGGSTSNFTFHQLATWEFFLSGTKWGPYSFTINM